ncbi:MAG: DsbA family protein [Dehalococcoidia bacterium]
MSNRQARREQARGSSASRQQRPRQTQKRPSGGGGGGSDIFSRGFLLAGVAFVVVAVAAIALVVAFSGDDGASSDSLVTDLEKSLADLPVDMISGNKIGSDDAPVKIVSYEDFQCPFCLQYTAEQEPAIVSELVKSGEVQIEYKHLPILGAESVSAAIASQCAADQDKFWQYHNTLFLAEAKADQVNNEKKNVGRFSDENLKKFAGDLGLDQAKFDQCYDSREHLDTITAQQREANQFGITGTPGFVVNGTPLGAGTPNGIDAWKQIVQNVKDAIATATANANATPSASASPAASGTAATTTTPAATATKTP